MFGDFSKMGEGIDALNTKFDRIVELLETIARNTTPPAAAEPEEERRHG